MQNTFVQKKQRKMLMKLTTGNILQKRHDSSRITHSKGPYTQDIFTHKIAILCVKISSVYGP
jgi:hypothetical protein